MIQIDPMGPGHFLLYGTSYGCGFTLGSPNGDTTYCGVKVYDSTDLQTWTPVGGFCADSPCTAHSPHLAFDPSSVQQYCDSDHFGCFRPKLVFKPDVYGPTGWKFILWVNYAKGYLIYSSYYPQGPYALEANRTTLGIKLAGSGGLIYGDEDVYQSGDSTSSAAYIAYTVIGPGNTHQIAIQQLDSTWMNVTGTAEILPPNFVEAPGIFYRQGHWYVVYSNPACPYCNNAATSYISSVSTGWSSWQSSWHTHSANINNNSCVGQPTDVNLLNGRYIYQTDRWAQKPGGSYEPNQYDANNYLAEIPASAFNDTNATIAYQSCVPSWTW